MSADETNVESISTAFRPMKLAEDYKEFCSQQWMSAKNALDKKVPQASERDRCELLNNILQVIFVDFHYEVVVYCFISQNREFSL